MKIAACLITRNSETVLERALTSIRPFVQGVFIYDTGSTDGTFELVEKLNETTELEVELPAAADVNGEQESGKATIPLAPITIRRGEWRDDFAWAREQSFTMPDDSFDWVLWLDDDDVIVNAEQLPVLAATAPAEVDGYVLFYDYARDEAGNCVCQLWRERLIRRDRGYEWKGVVHEVLCPPEGRPSGMVMVPPEQIHYRHERPADRYPSDRNLALLRAEAGRDGEQTTPRTLAYLGTELMTTGDQSNVAEACQWFERYLNHPEATWSDERVQVHHKLAACLRILGRVEAAAEIEFRALRERDDWAETYSGLCETFAVMGEWARSEHWAKLCLQTYEQTDRGVRTTPIIINPLELTFLPYVRLSEACVNTGRYQEAKDWLAKAAAIAPQHPLVTERAALYEKHQFEGELVQAMLTLREASIRFDENLKALILLEHAPYVIQDHPAIVQARAAARENTAHTTVRVIAEPNAEYLRWYADEPKESTVTDEMVPHAGDGFHRVSFLEQGLAEQEAELGRKPTVLDLGCNDFWMGAYLMGKGYQVDGVELNLRSYELALERAERFRGGGPAPLIVHGDLHDAHRLLDGCRYDAISLFEVIEHVADPAKTMAACEKLLNPGGRVYISTPDGAFEQGRLARWQVTERKGHLRAWPAHEFADRVSARGVIKTMDFGQGLTVLSYTPAKRRGKVVFFAGPCFEKWHPQQALTTGLGGSETALVQVATRLGLAGWQVKVYADVDPAMSAGGVIWRPHTAWDPMEDCDAMVVSRIPGAFEAPMRAPTRVLWCHDHSYPGLLTEELAARMTHVVTLSEWQRARFARLYPFLEGKLELIRNGITTVGLDGADRYPDGERSFSERKPRCVYSSSADRGLDVLLELWPQIRERVPDAELHVFYGFEILDRAAIVTPGLAEYKRKVLDLADLVGGEDGGVFLRGRTAQPVLAEEMQQARVWSYPTGFLETSCIGAMEARAAGLPIVTSELGALRESVGAHGQMIPWALEETEPWNQDRSYRTSFVDAVCRLLTDEQAWDGWHRRARAGVAGLDWSRRIPGWERVLRARKPDRKAPQAGRRRAAVAA